MNNNILTFFLKELNVKYTQSYSNNLFEEHPHKYDLYGISQMLHEYHIPNMGIRMTNKELHSLDSPFIAHIGNDFVVVTRIEDNTVHYRWNNKNISVAEEHFLQLWTGVVLIADPNDESCEPEYPKHYRQECLKNMQSMFLISIPFIALMTACICQPISIFNALLLSCNIVGIIICYLLLQKQLFTHNRYADKICSLFKQKDCNDILESDAAKLFGWISWSEIGLGYFITNAFVIGFLPSMCNYLMFFNVCALPYTIWSVYYQYHIAQQWCTLCLMIQGIIWTIFLLSLGTGNIHFSHLSMTGFIITCISYLFITLSINKITRLISVYQDVTNTKQELNSLKAIDEVFLSLLKKQTYHPVTNEDSCIRFGNPNALLKITILTNPHCNPCARMHKRVEKLLEKAGDKISIQYIFSSFNEDLKRSNQFLIAAYLNEGEEKARAIYQAWYEKEKYSVEQYSAQFHFSLNDAEVMQEMKRHDTWKEMNKISATPTILINGYLLPDKYKIEDMIEFVDLNINETF